MIGWRTLLLVALGLVMAAPGCRTREVDTPARYSDSEEFKAKAELLPKGEAKASGTVDMSQLVTPYSVRSGVPQVMTYVKVEGLDAGDYTVRLHDKGDCNAPATTADTSHNARKVTVGPHGVGTLAARLTKITIQPQTEGSVLGKAIVVHRGTGAEGTPVACGVIEAVAAADEHHGDEHHGDEAHGDEAHGDEAHGDEAHGGEAHGDEAHGDEAHGEADHGH